MTKKNQIIVHQAFYGEVNRRSHGCVFSTFEDAELNTFLTGFTDRPSAIPAGIVMLPYYSAIAHGKYYVFTLTFPDHTAQRAGMVFTHVLIIAIDDIEYVNNLDYLFSHFCKTIPENKTSIQVLIILISALETKETLGTFPEYVIQGARELANGKLPMLFCGKSELFIRLITSVWAGIPYSFRTKISFTAGFSTANMDTSKTVIHFQKNLQDSLRNSEFISDMATNLMEVNSTVEKYILTPLSNNQFDVFIKDLNVDLKDWSILQLCAKAYEGYQNYSQVSNDALKQLMRQLAKISPNKNEGKSIKEKVISELKLRIDLTQETNLKSLKNLPLDAFDSGEDVVADSVNSFVETELTKLNGFSDELMSEVIILSHNETQANWWHTAIKRALGNSIKAEHVTGIQNIWKLLISSEDSLPATLSFFPKDQKYQHLLIKHMPQNIPQNIAENFAKSIQKREWILLHAHLIRIYLHPKEALKQQLLLEQKLTLDSFEGSKLIAKDTTDDDILFLVMDTKEKFFIAEYAGRSIKKPTLLNDLDVTNQIWLSIWETILESGNTVVINLKDSKNKIYSLFDYIINGNNVSDKIINEISLSKFGNLLTYPNRINLWSRLPLATKDNFLIKTSAQLLEQLSKNLTIEIPNDTILLDHISRKGIADFLNDNRNNIESVIPIFEKFSQLSDYNLRDYLNNFTGQISAIDATQLGKLVARKRFSNSAYAINSKSSKDNNWRFALAECYDLLDFWTKLFSPYTGSLLSSSITQDEWWRNTEELIVELYSNGTSLTTIWKKAGGKESELLTKGTSSEIWSDALYKLRKEYFNAISMNNLLNEVKKQYGENQKFKIIYDLRKNFIKT